MSNASQQSKHIQAELDAIEAQNDIAKDREQLRQREKQVKDEVEAVADPVLKTELRRRLSVLRGQS